MLNYLNFINEDAVMDYTFMDNPKKHLLLFSDTIRKDYDENGGRFKIFYDFYKDPDYFVGLKLIKDQNRLKEIVKRYKNIRFTLLTQSSYKDTEEIGKRTLKYEPFNKNISVKKILDNIGDYYFYEIVKGERDHLKAPNRQNITGVIKNNNNDWIVAISKNQKCLLVKTRSRQEGGKWAEHKLSSLYGWEQSTKSIKMIVKKNDIIIRSNNLLKNILFSDDVDVFTVEDNPMTFVKYDLIVDYDKKLEVKKLKNREKDIWDGKPEPFMLAEQCKIADRSTLKRIVGWYRDIHKYDRRTKDYAESSMLHEMDEREIHYEFSNKIENNKPKIFSDSDICDKIRDFYNSKIEKLLDVFNRIDKNRWMAGIYGLYFTGEDRIDRRNDFLIKIDNNIIFEWKLVKEWLGFNRLKLYIYIDGDSWEHILVNDNQFLKAFQLKDYKEYSKQKDNGVIVTHDGDMLIYNPNEFHWEIQ